MAEPVKVCQETCQNPFRKRKCENTDIQLYIVIKGETIPICHNCWNRIADSNYEWENSKW
jgi:hypothetical protein